MHTVWCLVRNWPIVVRRHCLLSSFFRSKSRLLGQWVMRALRFRQTVIVLNGHINTVGNLSLFFLFARILSDCGVSWFEITFYEIMSHYHICYPKRNPLLQCDADSTCSGDFCQLASKVTITHKSGASSGSKCPILKWLYVKNHAKLLRGTHQRKRYRIKQLCNEVQLTKGLACIFRPWEMYLKMPSISLQTSGNVREGWSGE